MALGMELRIMCSLVMFCGWALGRSELHARITFTLVLRWVAELARLDET